MRHPDGLPLASACMRLLILGLIAAAATLVAMAAAARTPPPSVSELRATAFDAAWTVVRELPPGAGYRAQLVSYASSGLKLHALVATPTLPPPPGGFPVLVANHGFHPTPERYGITAAGVDSRPGDYYRPVPAAFTAAGFIVVMPDYRGHNISEGREYTGRFLASVYYSADVLALLPGLASLHQSNPRQLFMWGHSMGGEVTLRALLATDRVRGASLWSTVGGDLWERAYYYARFERLTSDDDDTQPKPPLDTLKRHIAAFGPGFDVAALEPLYHLQHLRTPLLLQHAVGDVSAPHRWSMRLAGELARRGRPYRFHSYAGDEHFFSGEAFRLAVERDVRFFRSLMTDPAAR